MIILSILLGCWLLFRLQAVLFRKYWDKKLEVSLRFSDIQATEGDCVRLHICIENRKWLILPSVKISFSLAEHFVSVGNRGDSQKENQTITELFSVLMHQRVTRTLEYRCKKRGYYRIEELSMKCGNFFQNEEFFGVLPSDAYLSVYPSCVDIRRFLEIYQNTYGLIVSNRWMQEDPFLHRGVREYQPYDSMNKIHWPATAKTGELKVHVPERTAYRDVIIYLNLQSDQYFLDVQLLEEAIRLAKTFCLQLQKEGIRCRIYTNGHDVLTDEFVTVSRVPANTSYMHYVDSKLARIKLRSYMAVAGDEAFEADHFLNCYREQILHDMQKHYLIFISNYQHGDFQELLLQIKKQGAEFSWIVPVTNKNDFHVEQALHRQASPWNLNYKR